MSKKCGVNGDIVTVEKYDFIIDRDKLEIKDILGEAIVYIKCNVKKYLGKGENEKYRVNSLLEIESKTPIKSVEIENPDKTTKNIEAINNKLTKDIEMILDEKYKVTIITQNDKKVTRTLIEKSTDIIHL